MWNHTILVTGVAIATFSLSGCLIIPTDFYASYSRQNVAEESPAVIVVGKTSREAVLLSLGEPDSASADETELWYIASKITALVIVGDRGGEIQQSHIHAVHFDRNGLAESLQHFNTAGNRSDAWNNEFGTRGYQISYVAEPHFSKTPDTFQVITK
jgi:outer membrane protein assembly factor BamE (lipoprotein component of BamABCDE complex)